MLAVVAGEDALAAVVDLVVGGVPVLDDLQAGVDLAAELRIGDVVAGEDGPVEIRWRMMPAAKFRV